MHTPLAIDPALIGELAALAASPALSQVERCWAMGKLIAGASPDSPLWMQALSGHLGEPALTPVSLRQMRDFHLAFPVWEPALAELSWTHYRILLVVADQEKRRRYWQEALQNQWSTRELARQIKTGYIDRHAPLDFREPYVFEFVGENGAGYEKDLETALIQRLQDFLLELGKGFAFVARQKRLYTATGKRFYIDLVFYHYILKCFVLVDLKSGELTHRDIGQMDMYLRFYDEKWRGPGDNPTLGLILCTHKDQSLVKYSMLAENANLFASTYRLHLPTEEELAAIPFFRHYFTAS